MEWQAVLLVVVAYLLGAVPFGLVFARAGGVDDLRQRGSGNIGATNVLRTAGKKAAVLTLLADALKGYLPVLAASKLGFGEAVTAVTAFAALAGHIFPVYLGFKGGKGVATGLGVVLGFMPVVGLVVLVTWLAMAAVFRYSSLAALAACAGLPLFTFWLNPTQPAILFSLAAGGLILFRHTDNMKRLLSGKEKKIGEKG
ncbi:MAG: glycerol-3-phosphate 1-O-acyltransferase PlsY [Nitrospirota bacterium]|nr:glycerol-3-phosphate 1-O-acyltransferase PlsY [Nitrospirota bacterium]